MGVKRELQPELCGHGVARLSACGLDSAMRCGLRPDCKSVDVKIKKAAASPARQLAAHQQLGRQRNKSAATGRFAEPASSWPDTEQKNSSHYTILPLVLRSRIGGMAPNKVNQTSPRRAEGRKQKQQRRDKKEERREKGDERRKPLGGQREENRQNKDGARESQ